MTHPGLSGTTARIAALAFVLLAVAAPAALAQRFLGEETFTTPHRTDAGSWQGTWAYSNRDLRIVLWLRDTGGKMPEASLSYFDTRNSESFRTDWSGQVEYVHRSRPGRFALRLNEAGAEGIDGTWDLSLGGGTDGRTESGRFRLFRAGDGRLGVMQFDAYDLVLLGAPPKRVTTSQAWTFRKLSRRFVEIEELPL